MTLTMTAVPGSTATPSVTLGVTSSPSLTAALEVYRAHEDGTVHRVLAASDVLIGSWVGVDYHCPFNQPVTYYAVAGGLTSAATGPVWSLSESSWLVSAVDPALSVMVEKIIGPAAPYTYATRANRLQVLNAKLPVSRSDYPRGGESGQVVVKCSTPADRAAVKALLADDMPVLLNTRYTDDDMGWKWVQVGDLTISNPGGFVDFPYRYATLPYTECRQPDSDQRVRTFDEVEAEFPGASFDDMEAVYATFNDSELDVRLP